MIPGLIDEILCRLPTPYDIIAEWTQYIPLDHLLGLNFFALYMSEEHLKTVSLHWGRYGRFDVPKALFQRTIAYTDQTWAIRMALPAPNCGMFVTAHGIVGSSDFRRQVIEVGSSIQNGATGAFEDP